MRVAIILPTVGGLGLIGAINTLSTRLPSRVRLNSDYQPLPGLSKRYMSLTAAGGPLSGFLEDDVHHDLEIDLEPETGRSWEMPVALAHWVFFQGHEIVTESPDVIIWSTGALQADGRILPDSYHVKDKLAVSSARISALGNARLFLLLPEGQNASDVQIQFSTAIISRVSSLKDAISALNSLETRPLPAPVTTPPTGSRAFIPALSAATWGRWLAGGGAGLSLLAAFFYLQNSLAPAVQPKQRSASNPQSAQEASGPENRVQIKYHGSWVMAMHHVYNAELFNPGPEAVRVTSLRVANASGDGLLADGAFILPADSRQSLLFFLKGQIEDDEAAIVCLSGETREIAWHERSLYRSGKMTDHDVRTGDPFPECNDIDFSWLEFSSHSECLKVQERLGALAASDCTGLIDQAPERGDREPTEDVQACTARVIEEHFNNEITFADAAVDSVSLLGKTTLSEREQIVFIGGQLISMGQGGNGVLQRSAEQYCSERR